MSDTLIEAHLPAEIGERWLSPPAMLDRALTSNANPEVIRSLMDLAERYDANLARKAFNKALAAAKAEIPILKKNRHVGFDSRKPGAARTDYKHEDLAEAIGTVDPILAKHGLFISFETKQSDIAGMITVTCRINHEDGHFVENSLPGMPDLSGNKNSIQSVGSTVTYLQRYTLKAALGLAAANDDDGAKGDGGDVPTTEQLAALRALMVEAGVTEEDFVENTLHIIALEDIRASKVEVALRLLREKKIVNAKQKAGK